MTMQQLGREFSEDMPDPTSRRGHILSLRPTRSCGAGGRFNPARAYCVTYVTQRRDNAPYSSATATLIRSLKPWTGAGVRPLIALAPSTQGVARKCDPSVTCTSGIKFFPGERDVAMNYELPVMNYFLRQGAHILCIDYPRDPQTDVQLYCDHEAGAHALIDAVRASTLAGVSECTPVGLWGFSQGGGTVGWAVEHLVSELPHIRAAVVGAPPADLIEMLRSVDGTMLTGLIAYAVVGLLGSESFSSENNACTALFTNYGLRRIRECVDKCACGVTRACAWEHTREWTRTGKSLADVVSTDDRLSWLCERQRIGLGVPSIPTLLWGSRYDDVVPFSQVEAVRDAWLARGSAVKWKSYGIGRIPGKTPLSHFLPYFEGFPRNARWLLSHVIATA